MTVYGIARASTRKQQASLPTHIPMFRFGHLQ